MRYLKLFELYSKKSIAETCDDILVDLQDDGYEVDVSIDNISTLDNEDSPDSIAVSIGKGGEIFSGDGIKDVIDRVIEYLKGEGYILEIPLRIMHVGVLCPANDIVGRKISRVGFVFNKI